MTKSYKIISAQGDDSVCRLIVGFSVYGYISESEAFQNKQADEKWTVKVHCHKKKCEIDLAFKEFKIGPHPGKDATVKWLKGLEAIRTSAADKHRDRALQERITSLP